jgi:hypothetical protein
MGAVAANRKGSSAERQVLWRSVPDEAEFLVISGCLEGAAFSRGERKSIAGNGGRCRVRANAAAGRNQPATDSDRPCSPYAAAWLDLASRSGVRRHATRASISAHTGKYLLGYAASRRSWRLLDLGSVMKLIEAIRDLESLDEESTIYAAEPWHEDSEAIVAREPDSGGLPAEAEKRGLKYFLEVFIARDFAADWASALGAQPSLQQKCARLIKYASTDA